MSIQEISLIGRFRIFLYLILVLLFIAAYFLGYAIKPSPQFASQINQELTSFNNELNKLPPTAQFSYKLTNLLISLGPSLIPVYGIWNTALQWVISGIATNAVSSNVGMSIMAQSIILAIILGFPSSDGLILVFSLINYARNRQFRNITILTLRWYLMAVIIVLIFVILFSALL